MPDTAIPPARPMTRADAYLMYDGALPGDVLRGIEARERQEKAAYDAAEMLSATLCTAGAMAIEAGGKLVATVVRDPLQARAATAKIKRQLDGMAAALAAYEARL